MKNRLQQLLIKAVETLQADKRLPADLPLNFRVEHSRDAAHGDYASNIAMMLCKPAQLPPRQLAELLKTELEKSNDIVKVEIAGPGFINFFVASEHSIVQEILEKGNQFGCHNVGQNKRVIVEFVSANPTGPLHVGHGRGAAYGSVVADLLAANGYQVHREYYVNDAGRQMNILAVSVWLRYLELLGVKFTFPSNGYRGDYILAIARDLKAQYDKQFYQTAEDIFSDLPKDEPEGGDKDLYIDALVDRAKELLKQDYDIVHHYGLSAILEDIKQDLEEFGVTFEEWFSEKSLLESGAIKKGIDALRQRGYIYEKEGAIWFKATAFHDEKDRVLVRRNGVTTYFASDVAYHWNKLNRGFEILIDIFGADHHGYVSRVHAAIEALGLPSDAIKIPLVQFASLYRHGEKVQMSTRSGSFVTLRELREEVGNEAARFFYIMRKCDQHMDFDLDLAKSKSNENPVYYIQYAHARICSVFRQVKERGWEYDKAAGMSALGALEHASEKSLITELTRYPEVILRSVEQLAPHLVTNYLRELANAFHSYYNAVQFMVDDAVLRQARLTLILAVKQVLANGLALLRISAPEEM